jgi:hypothetical protein
MGGMNKIFTDFENSGTTGGLNCSNITGASCPQGLFINGKG